MYVYRNIEELSCRGKAITHSVCVCVCVFVALSIQHAMGMRHIAFCGLPHSTKAFHIIS